MPTAIAPLDGALVFSPLRNFDGMALFGQFALWKKSTTYLSTSPMDMNLSLYETRVLGSLMEKEITTPEQYPLSLNALVNACNQKSSREPVLELDEKTVQDTVDDLVKKRLVMEQSGFGSRVVKIKHRFCNTEFSEFKFTPQELAIICVLFLRGPQTPGELRTRTTRLCSFPDVRAVEETLEQLEQRNNNALVVKLPREPGKRESRYAHLFGGEVDLSQHAPTINASGNSDDSKILALEKRLDNLSRELEEVKTILNELLS